MRLPLTLTPGSWSVKSSHLKQLSWMESCDGAHCLRLGEAFNWMKCGTFLHSKSANVSRNLSWKCDRLNSFMAECISYYRHVNESSSVLFTVEVTVNLGLNGELRIKPKHNFLQKWVNFLGALNIGFYYNLGFSHKVASFTPNIMSITKFSSDLNIMNLSDSFFVAMETF